MNLVCSIKLTILTITTLQNTKINVHRTKYLTLPVTSFKMQLIVSVIRDKREHRTFFLRFR